MAGHAQGRAEAIRWNRRGMLVGGAALAMAAAVPAAAETIDLTKRQARLLTDFPWLARYADENAALLAAHAPVNIVFMGDSITERWQKFDPAFFGPGRICRGIGGQTTPQMLLRMMADVIALRPGTVHIMGGTNDIAGNTGPMTPQQTLDNIRAMTMLARQAGCAVLIGSILPAAAFRWSPSVQPAQTILALNARLQAFAREVGATWVDYHTHLATPEGGMREGLASDGVHPTPSGYAIMDAVLAPILKTRGIA